MADFGTSYLYGFTGTGVNREDVVDAIFNIDPFDTPFFQMAPKVPANHTTVEWLEDSLAATSTAVRTEGQAFTQDNISAATRVTNVTQIMGKHFIVSETQQVLNPYGYTEAFLYEAMKASREVMRNFEVSFFRSSGGSATGSGTAVTGMDGRVMKSLDDFIVSEKHHVNSTTLGGSDSTSGASATGLQESAFNTALELIYDNGGNPNWVFTAGPGKRAISSFAGAITSGTTALTIFTNASEHAIDRAVNSYRSDFGMLNVALDRFVPKGGTGTNLNGAVYILELPRTQIAILRPIRFEQLAKDGDRVRGMTLGELSLKVMNQAAHGRLLGVSSAAPFAAG